MKVIIELDLNDGDKPFELINTYSDFAEYDPGLCMIYYIEDLPFLPRENDYVGTKFGDGMVSMVYFNFDKNVTDIAYMSKVMVRLC